METKSSTTVTHKGAWMRGTVTDGEAVSVTIKRPDYIETYSMSPRYGPDSISLTSADEVAQLRDELTQLLKEI